MSKYRYGYVEARIDVSEVIDQIEDDDLKAEYNSRFGLAPSVKFDLLNEIHHELISGRVQYALAMIESEMNAQRFTDDQRQAEYQQANRVGAPH